MSDGVSQRASSDQDERTRFKRLSVRVLVVQLIALALLWLLQSRFGSG